MIIKPAAFAVGIFGFMEHKKYTHKSIAVLLFISIFCLFLTACAKTDLEEGSTDKQADISDAVSKEESPREEEADYAYTTLTLKYATQFSVDMYDNGIKLIHIADGYNYLLLPNDMDEAIAGNIAKDAVIIKEGVSSIYNAASSAMDLIREIDELDRVKTCSTKASDYSIDEISRAIDSGRMKYVGKYSAPDYELLLNEGTGLAIESTMIYHTPKVKEQLERLGIPVLIERSSYEPQPLGRLEWIKLYGLLLGRYDEANEFFEAECARVDKLNKGMKAKGEKKVAFFSLSPNGYVNVRKPKDYVSAMIEMAGGSYAFSSLAEDEKNALSTVKLNWEDFYKDAVDADIIIYNSTIYGGFESLDGLIAQNRLFLDFKAVKENNVWCTNLNMFQESSKLAVIIEDLYKVINDADADTAEFLYKLE